MHIYSAKYSQDKKFYYYEYLRSLKSIFGDVGSPYYIGKGCGRRAYKKDSSEFKPPKDRNRIIVSNLMNEADSLQCEILKINLYGRIDLNTGCLRNKTDGGEGIFRARFKRNPVATAKMVNTRKANGTYKRTKENNDKMIATRIKNGNLHSYTNLSKEKARKTRIKNGTTKRKADSILKTNISRILNGTAQNNPDIIAKCLATKKRNGTLKRSSDSGKKSWETRRKNQLLYSAKTSDDVINN